MPQAKNQITPLGVVLAILWITVTGSVVWRVSHPPQPSSALERIRRTGAVRIGFANEPPYGYYVTTTGQITGEAPEIAKVILHRLGAKQIEPVVTEFGALIPGLKAGRFDLIAAGMYVTPQRAKEIDFSNPTYAIGEGFIVRAGNPLHLHSYQDVAANPQARIGVMGGSVEHGYAQQLGVPENRIVVFPDYRSAIDGITANRIDAAAATILTVNDLLAKADDDRIESAEPFENPVIDGKSILGYGAFGFQKHDDELRLAFNQEIADFVGTPEHLQLIEPFGFGKSTLPGDITTAQVIGSDEP
ncbi:ectoine/hydroxyectoine ABC transporter substrate-binding protein EhuB [Blastopirellula marina]|uniref:Putative extracellular solute-binding protein n=1 Tax=Blastopirellula marina DSM 3645 TaxID=314230 RepID=A3ZVE5_9BACT|nr:ectoine/hydroxyectoine ABC transporter substrate-binding protein EhuB [Blastopirellula marina]EAQ79291.1 putative extracellular solute-binding protein [Blastopirellula marina DSM 3645]